ncbi:IS256 family transposase, variant Zn-binding type [Sulfurimonas sp.]|uniref:IS256 family transposase, variant Zn-binding type n=2 Tax=Sulfurimonas sp. TaxID=2022749 RepID=UPI003A7F3FBE
MCPHCTSKKTKKNGELGGIQRYKCSSCNSYFSSKRRPDKLQEIIFKKYIYKRQTLSDLAEEYKKSSRWIQKQIFEYEPNIKYHKPRAIVLICDATFYGKRKDKLGTLVFKDDITKEILLSKHIQSELSADYKLLLNQLLELGYTVLSVTIDGKRGLQKVFKDFPLQMCHFHQAKTVRRYITKRPRLQAGKDLKKIMYRLTQTNEKKFTKKLDEWYETYKNFIEEKSINNDTGKSYYTHQKVRAAYRSLRANLSYLFTRNKYKNFKIPNTTNTLDGGTFSPLKILIKIHRGLSKSLKLKMVDDYLLNYKKK